MLAETCGRYARSERECDRLPPCRTESFAHLCRHPPSVPSFDILESKPNGLSNRSSCARPIDIISCDHITRSYSSPARRGLSTSLSRTLILFTFINAYEAKTCSLAHVLHYCVDNISAYVGGHQSPVMQNSEPFINIRSLR